MIPYSNTEREYVNFNLKYLHKFKDFEQDYNKLSEKNKTRIMVEISKILPLSIFSFEQELSRRK